MSDSNQNISQQTILGEARAFVKNEVPRQLLLAMDAEKVRYPRNYVENLARHNLLGIRFPIKFGGRDLDWSHEILVLEEIGVLGASLACLYSLPSIVGEAIQVFGSNYQKEKFLSKIISGKITVAEALTEPRGGSDFFGATTQAVRVGNEYVLNGQKRFIVGAEGADVFMVYARTGTIDNRHRSMSAFLVERGKGLEVEHVYGLMGTRGGGTGRVYFRNVRVPVENLLGEENNAVDIFNQMMIPERMTSAAGALGLARAALETAAHYANQRKAFGQKIREFEGVSFKVSESLTRLDAARALVRETARMIDSGGDPGQIRRLVSESKKFATETAWYVVNDAMQIMGGIGYTNVYPIERLLRDARLMLIWTGTNEIMNLVIQHEYYKELTTRKPTSRIVEMDALNADLETEKIYE
ncbi:MAG: acyl-CoA dehydrogenase [Chloroflexi bacterium GWB2_49_20]|nr:MAG: acyl-CoA dehydrogenase [Chloroflexi bacterium GWB2_49_20]OGN77889.1 MAG: acyl-CoA dehydrogenase [Chloroflexi bacterium GWC2_49_37]OGN82730.1 MAG: acyl-CoA dehydrogenase [Chloroflexi bacterium GWD2_49_16]HCM96124.1 acyl-CoA dehydrogenase [Anaerolineae bacterium]